MLSHTSASTADAFDFIVEMRLSRCLWDSPSLIFALCWRKALQAVSNAESNHGIREERLYVKAAYADSGPVMKRWRARARGRVARIRTRTCHITVLLAELPQAAPTAEPVEAEVVEETPAPKPAPATKKTAAASKKKTASTRPAKKKETAS